MAESIIDRAIKKRLNDTVAPIEPDRPQVQTPLHSPIVQQALQARLKSGAQVSLPPVTSGTPTLSTKPVLGVSVGASLPQTVPLRPSPILPASEINKDANDETIKNLFTSRGLTTGYFSENDFNKWFRRYQLNLEKSDPAFKSYFVDLTDKLSSPTDSAMAAGLIQGWRQNIKLLYAAQHGEPGSNELSFSVNDALETYWKSPLVNQAGQIVRPPGAAPPINPIQLTSISDKLLRKEVLTPEEKVLLDQAGGPNFFKFWDQHRDWFLARNRLEILSGRRVDRDQQYQINADTTIDPHIEGKLKATADNSPFGKAWYLAGSMPSLMGGYGPPPDKFSPASLPANRITTVPFEPNFHHSYLNPISPELTAIDLGIQTTRESAAASLRAERIADLQKIASTEPPKFGQEFPPWAAQEREQAKAELQQLQADPNRSPPLTRQEKASQRFNSTVSTAFGALNALTLGFWEATYNALDTTGRTISPEKWDMYVRTVPGVVYKALISQFDPQGTEKPARYDEFWRLLSPVDDPVFDTLTTRERLSPINLTNNVFARAKAGAPGSSSIFRALGVNFPLAQDTINVFNQLFTEDGVNLLLTGLGTKGLRDAISGGRPLPTLKTPMRGRVPWRLEHELAKAGQSSPVPAAARVHLMAEITDALTAVKDPTAARNLMTRLNEEVQLRGPLDPALTAGFLAAVKSTTDTINSFQGTTLTKAAKHALLDTAEGIADLGVTEAFRVIHGEIPYVNAKESARYAGKLAYVLDALERSPDLPVPQALKLLSPDNRPNSWVKQLSALQEAHQLRITTAANKARVLQILDKLDPQIVDELRLIRDEQATFDGIRERLINTWNDDISSTFTKWHDFELKGGWLPRANPVMYKKVYANLKDLISGNPSYTLDHLVSDSFAMKQLAGKSAEALVKDYHSRNIVERISAKKQISRLVDSWLEENSRPEYVHVPPKDTPRTSFIDAFIEKLDKHNPDKPLDLTPAEMSILSEVRPEFAKLRQDFFNNKLKAIEADIKNSDNNFRNRMLFKRNLDEFRQIVNDIDPLKPTPRLESKLSPTFRAALEAELNSPPWLIRNNKYLSITDGITNLDGLKAFHEVLGKVNKDAEIVGGGLLKYSNLDSAVAHAIDPRRAVYMLRDTRRTAQNFENYVRYEIQKAAKILGREKLSVADWQNLLIDLKDNNPRLPEAKILLQRLMYKLLEFSYLSGRIDAAHFTKFAANQHYYHGVFNRNKDAVLPIVRIDRPSRYNDLRVSPYEFSFKIPEDSWYVAWKEGKTEKHQPGFPDRDAAFEWAEKQNFPSGTEVAIHPPYKFSAKEAEGLIVDAGTSMIDLVDRMGMNSANALTSRAVAMSPFARSALELPPEARTRISWTDPATGQTWYKIDDRRAGDMHGKYLHEHGVNWLAYTNANYGWYKAFLAGLQSETGLFNVTGAPLTSQKANPLLTSVERFLEKSVGRQVSTGWLTKFNLVAGNLLGISKVALNPTMVSVQWITDLVWNLPLMGVNVLSPIGFGQFTRFGFEGVRNWIERRGDVYWDMLFKEGLLESSRVAFDSLHEKYLKDHWNSYEGYIERAKRNDLAIADELAKATPDQKELNRLTEYKISLENEMNRVGPKHLHTLTGKLINHALNNVEGIKGLVVGNGVWNENLYKYVSLPDALSKYIGLRSMIETRGMSPQAALGYVDAFAQNLHRSPEPIKQLSRYLGGSKFTTFPFNMATTFYNAATKRPAWFIKYHLQLLAWNSAMLAAQRRDIDDTLNGQAIIEGWGRPDVMSKMAFLFGRIMLPNGGYVSTDSIYGWLLPRSQISRDLNENLMGAEQSSIAKALEQVSVGFFSKFFLGSVGSNFLYSMGTGRDYRGNPLHSVEDWVKNMVSTLGPDVLPPWGRDWQEFQSAISTNYRNPITGEQKDPLDYALRRFFSVYPPESMNSNARARAVLKSILNNNPDAAKFHSMIPFDETLRSLLYANGSVRDDGQIIWDDKAKQITSDFLKEHGTKLELASGEKIPSSVEAKELRAKFESAMKPSFIESVRKLNIRDQLLFYGKWHKFDKDFDPDIDRKLIAMIGYKFMNESPELHLVKDIDPLLKSWGADPDLPARTRNLIRGWAALARQKYTERKTP